MVVLNQNIYHCWVSGCCMRTSTVVGSVVVVWEHLPLLGQWLLYENIYRCWVSGCCIRLVPRLAEEADGDPLLYDASLRPMYQTKWRQTTFQVRPQLLYTHSQSFWCDHNHAPNPKHLSMMRSHNLIVTLPVQFCYCQYIKKNLYEFCLCCSMLYLKAYGAHIHVSGICVNALWKHKSKHLIIIIILWYFF